jgi:serine/threonine-protein kinase
MPGVEYPLGGTPDTGQNDPAHWARVKTVFLGALDREESEQAAYIATECAGDELLRRDIEALLRSDQAAGDFCEDPAPRLIVGEPPPPTPHRLNPGASVGSFLVTAFVGAGGMGEVYRARHPERAGEVAIKTLRATPWDALEGTRLLKEAHHASTLSHPNICAIHEVGEAEGVPFIVMEYADGRALTELCRGTPLAPDHAVRIALQIADAVAHAHERGIVHRDLKSANVVVDTTGKAIVLDFGLAKQLPDGDLRRTVESFSANEALAGTLSYMAPEVLSGVGADTRSDIWSLGVLLYEMVTGTLPFEGRTPFETSSAIIAERPRWMGPRVPLALRLVIERCLAKNPATRYQRAADVRAALERIDGRHSWTFAGQFMMQRRAAVLAVVGAVIALSVAIWSVERFQGAAATGPGDGAVKTLAVLPIDNATGNAALSYYADGVTDALIAETGALGSVRVVSRTSAQQAIKQRNTPVDIGAALGAGMLVRGTLQNAADAVVLHIALVDAPSGRVLWEDRFERPAREILALQADVVAALAARVQITMAPLARERLAKARAVSPDVYEAYLKGRYDWNQRTPASIVSAADHFSRAIELDPSYAPAYAALADCYNQQATLMVGTDSPKPFRAKAAEAAIRALQIDPDLADAHAALGYVRHYEWQWAEAERELKRAIDLNPSNPLSRIWYANLLMSRRRMDEALRQALVARDLDPFSPIINANVGWIQVYARRPHEAIEQLTKTVAMNPDYATGRWRLVKALLLADRAGDAVVEADAVVQSGNQSAAALSVLGVAAAHAHDTARARMLLNRLLDLRQHRYVAPGAIADVYLAVGDLDSAFPWMNRALDEGSNWAAYIAGDPANDGIRNDPRFQRLLARTGLDAAR